MTTRSCPRPRSRRSPSGKQESKQVIVIEPTDPNTIYVPYYDPAVVYGEWPYACLSALLFCGAALYRRRPDRHRPCLRRRLCAGPLEQLLGRRLQLGQQQFLHQPLQHHQQYWQQLAAQSGSPSGRPIQQRRRPAEIRQQQSAGRRRRPDGLPRPRRPEGARSRKGPSRLGDRAGDRGGADRAGADRPGRRRPRQAADRAQGR